MWIQLFLAALLCSVFLYLPGYLANRAFLSSRLRAAAFAPVTSIAVFVILGVLLSSVAVPCLAVPLLSALLGFLAWLFARRPIDPGRRADFRVVALYLAVGVVTALAIFLYNIDGASSFSTRTDTSFHLQCAQAMLDSGRYSILNASSEYPYVMAASEGSFYPAAWHIVVACAAGALSLPTTVCSNALNFAICSFVFPFSCWLFLSWLFCEKKEYVVAGGLVCSVFACFPWSFFVYGQYDANLLAFALVPSCLFVLLCLLGSDEENPSLRSLAVMFVLCCVALAASQTNALFAVGVLCIPLIIRFVWRKFGGRSAVAKSGVAVAATALAIGGIWYLAYSLPFMQGVVQFEHPIVAGHFRAIANIAALSFDSFFAPQPVLGLLVLAGAVLVAVKQRDYLWLVFSWLIAGFLYFVCASVPDPIRQLLCGFWYTGIIRIGGMVVLAAIPLAAMGLGAVISFAGNRFSIQGTAKPAIIAGLCLVLTGAGSSVLLKACGIKSGLQNVAETIEADYKYSHPVAFTDSEREFVSEAKLYVGNDLVVNVPSDGSVWLYATDGINTMCRRFYDSPNAEYDLMKKSLCDVSSNAEVRQAVNDVDAKYVLLLDESVHAGKFKDDDWKGILSITDETPGFDPLLSQGSMRLYRIEV